MTRRTRQPFRIKGLTDSHPSKYRIGLETSGALGWGCTATLLQIKTSLPPAGWKRRRLPESSSAIFSRSLSGSVTSARLKMSSITLAVRLRRQRLRRLICPAIRKRPLLGRAQARAPRQHPGVRAAVPWFEFNLVEGGHHVDLTEHLQHQGIGCRLFVEGYG
jgi:hypothetical protein